MKSTVEYLETIFNSLTLKPSHFALNKMGRLYDIADCYHNAIAILIYAGLHRIYCFKEQQRKY